MASSPTQHAKFGGRDGPDNGLFSHLELQNIGLDIPFGPFVSLVDALLNPPTPHFPIAAGENGPSTAQSNLFWTYNAHTGLQVQAAPGFLTTASGDGGFRLNVMPDGSWALQFDGSGKVIGYDAEDNPLPATPPPPPADNTILNVAVNGPVGVNASAGHITVNGNGSADQPVVGYDTISGGVGDYMIGGDGTGGGGPGGHGNCAVYTSSPGSILVDAQNGFGYGANAEANVYVNINQIRGSFFSNVLIGNASGTDLKSGGNNSLLISTGGNGFEMRPDGSGNVLVSTVGADKIEFDPTHGWALGDDNILLGFNASHGDFIDLTLLGSDFHSVSAAGYDPSTGTGDINDYVSFVQQADGEHLMFSPTGNVQGAGVELLDMKLAHGLSAQDLYQSHNVVL